MRTHHDKHPTQPLTGSTGPAASMPPVHDSAREEHNGQMVSPAEIRLCAYRKWENAGKPTGDGIKFWLEAEQELIARMDEKFAQPDDWPGRHEHERRESENAAQTRQLSVDSHYRDNNRMFQSHGDRGHRHNGGG